jgi:hypothetical protein
MSKVTLKNLSHSYLKKQEKDSDFVLTNINIDWNDIGTKLNYEILIKLNNSNF